MSKNNGQNRYSLFPSISLLFTANTFVKLFHFLLRAVFFYFTFLFPLRPYTVPMRSTEERNVCRGSAPIRPVLLTQGQWQRRNRVQKCLGFVCFRKPCRQRIQRGLLNVSVRERVERASSHSGVRPGTRRD